MRLPLLLFAAAAIYLAACAESSGINPGDRTGPRGTVVLGQVDLSFYAVTGEVTQRLLKRRGYAVEVVTGDHATIYPQLGRGEVHLLAASWLPTGHAGLFAEVADEVERLTPLYGDARFYWAVPAYVPEEEVGSVADLTSEAVAARMPDTIATLPDGTGLTVASRELAEAYGLDAAYRLVPGGPEAWTASLRDAVDEEAWTVLPLWQPQWVNAAYDLRELDDPRGVLPPPDTAWLIAHRTLRDVVDEATLDELAALRLTVAEVTEMDRLVNVEGLTPAEAALRWERGELDAKNRDD